MQRAADARQGRGRGQGARHRRAEGARAGRAGSRRALPAGSRRARARASADERRKREDEARDAAVSIRTRAPRNWPKTVGIGLVVLLVVAIGLLHFMPLNDYIPGAQEAMSQRLGVPVTISSLRYALLPTPQLTPGRRGARQAAGSQDRQHRGERGPARRCSRTPRTSTRSR